MEKITLLALILTLIKSVAGVCEQVIVSFPPEGYTGTVKIKDGRPTLEDTGPQGINFLAICKDDRDANTPTIFVEGQFQDDFVIQDANVKDPLNVAFTVGENYDIVSTIPFPVRIYACPPGTTAGQDLESVCSTTETSDEVQIPELIVTLTYESNVAAPTFNIPTVTAKIEDAETCAKPCPVIFDETFIASDLDGVAYSVFGAQPYSSNFEITNKSDLSTLSLTDVVSQNTAIDLVIEATDLRPSWDIRSSVAVVSISIGTSATTQAPTTNVPTESTTSGGDDGECDDDNKELYFILMIVFASLLGLALLVLICTPIILKLCRRDNVLGITGTNSNKAHLINGGVLKEGATFTQFSEMNYDTLGGDTQSNRSTSTDSSPELQPRITASGRVKAKSSKGSNSENPYFSNSN